MALQFDNYLFFHVPRCGGNYVRALVEKFYKENNLFQDMREIGSPHCHALAIDTDEFHRSTTFCVVRHPATWYQSYYGYRILKGWRPNHHIDQRCMASLYHVFVDKMLMAFPFGWYTQFLSMIVPYVDYIIPLSQLQKGMEQIIDTMIYDFGVVFPDFINTKDYNTGKKDFNFVLPANLRKDFDAIEVQSFKRLMSHHVRKLWFYEEALKQFELLEA